MTLTEEQRGALARAIDYINETDLPVGELDGFDREVLRNMVTTAINYGPDVMKMIELLAAGEHDQWADWAQSILDSEPGLSDGRKAAWPEMIATPYENLSEELKDKDRREVHLRSQVVLDYIQQQSAEIERLTVEHQNALDEVKNLEEQNLLRKQENERLLASLVEHEEHENQTHAILGAILGTDDTLENVAKRAMARIAELEDALVEERARGNHYGISYEEVVQPDGEIERWIIDGEKDLPKFCLDRVRAEARRQLKEEGKIGPDAAKPRSWQITEERKAALWHAIKVLKENDIMEEPEEHLWDEEVTVLQAMLTEAE